MVKRLRLRPLTPATGVRIPVESPIKIDGDLPSIFIGSPTGDSEPARLQQNLQSSSNVSPFLHLSGSHLSVAKILAPANTPVESTPNDTNPLDYNKTYNHLVTSHHFFI